LIAAGHHTTFAAGDHLPGMEREAGNMAVRFTNFGPVVPPIVFRAESTRSILHDRQMILISYCQNLIHVAHKTHLMHNKDTASARRYQSLQQFCVQTVGVVDVYKFRNRSTIKYRMYSRDKRMARYYDFLTWAYIQSPQSQMKPCCGTGNGAGAAASYIFRELLFERLDLWSLCQPAGS